MRGLAHRRGGGGLQRAQRAPGICDQSESVRTVSMASGGHVRFQSRVDFGGSARRRSGRREPDEGSGKVRARQQPRRGTREVTHDADSENSVETVLKPGHSSERPPAAAGGGCHEADYFWRGPGVAWSRTRATGIFG